MKKYFLIIPIFCLFNVEFAQQTDSLKTKRWAVGISASPDISYKIPYSPPNSGILLNEQTYIINTCVGLNINYSFTKRINVETGILYSGKGQVVISPATNWQTPGGTWQTPDGTYDPSIPNSGNSSIVYSPEKRINIKYNYLEIPLKCNINIINRRFKLFPSIGASANVFIGKTVTETYKDDQGNKQKSKDRSYNTNNIPVVDMALMAGIGFSYDINKHLYVKLEPNYRQFIRPLVDFPISGYFYSFGCNTGLYYRF